MFFRVNKISSKIASLASSIVLLAAFLAINFNLNAQVFPVDVNSVVNPPYSPFFAEYSQPGSNRWSTIVTLRDLHAGNLQVRFRISIESNTVLIQTKPNFRPTSPVTLLPNVPQNIQGSALAEYLDFNSLDFQGITRQAIEQNGKIPEGMYTFRFQVLEFFSGKVISNTSIANAYIQLRDQPLALNPMCGNPVFPSQGQNTIFQWQAASPPGPGALGATDYVFTLYEIFDPLVNPMNALANNKVIQVFQSQPQQQTTLVYGLSQPVLELGKRYLWRVQATDERGFASFKNNGYSEICWFSYGYPTGGNINLSKPNDNFAFTKNDLFVFQWSAIDNYVPGQQTSYTLKIVEKNAGQSAGDALKYNLPYLEQTSVAMPASSGYSVMLDSLPKDKDFAWKIIAKSGEQTVAESPARSFSSPSFLEKFNTGNHVVYVSALENKDLNNLKGRGKVKIGSEDSSFIEVSFSGLKVSNVAGLLTLTDGEILSQVVMDTIHLNSSLSELTHAVFYPKELKLNKNELSLKGYAKMPFPLAVSGNQLAEIETQESWVTFNNYQVTGQLHLKTGSSYALMDPMNHTLDYDSEKAHFLVGNNKYVLSLTGKIHLPKSVVDLKAQEVSIPFFGFDRFLYNEIEDVQYLAHTEVSAMPNSDIAYLPKKVVVDFSPSKSPGKKQGEPSWTGVYFETGKLTAPKTFDRSKQLFLTEPVDLDASLSNNYMKNSWVEPSGLNFHIDYTPAQEMLGALNTFPGKLSHIKIEIEDGIVQAGDMMMDIVIPAISPDKLFKAVVPVVSKGFDLPYLPSDFKQVIEFDKDNPIRKMAVTLTQPYFDENGNLDFVFDVVNDPLRLSMKGLEHLKINGVGDLGIGRIGDALSLTDSYEAFMDNIPIRVDKIAFGITKRGIGLGIEAVVAVGNMVSALEGPARIVLTAASPIQTPKVGFSIEKITEDKDGFQGSGYQAELTGEVKANPLVGKVMSGIETVVGNGVEMQDYTAKAKAGGSFISNKDGWKASAYIEVDLGIASAKGDVYTMYTTEFGGEMLVMQGQVDVAFPAIPGATWPASAGGQLIVGAHESKQGNIKPIILVRAYVRGIDMDFSPFGKFRNFGFAVGTFVSPEKGYVHEDFTPVTELRYAADLNSPLTVFLSAGITDPVKNIEGVIYEIDVWGGKRLDASADIDLDNPSSLKNIQFCQTVGFRGSNINLNAGSLGLFVKQGSLFKWGGVADWCMGQVFEMKAIAKGDGKVQIPLTQDVSLLHACIEGEAELDARLDLRNINSSSNRFKMKLGTEEKPLSFKPWCSNSIRLEKWMTMEIANNRFLMELGIRAQMKVNVSSPRLTVLPETWIQPYFYMDALLQTNTMVDIGMSSFSRNPDPDFTISFAVKAHWYFGVGVRYSTPFNKGNVNIGEIGINAEGKITATQKNIDLAARFNLSVRVIGKSFNVGWDGSARIV